MKNRLFTILRALISFSLIGLLIWFMRAGIPDIIKTIGKADRHFLFLGFFTYLFSIILIAVRLSKVISVQSIHITIKEAIYLTFIGFFFNNFLPTSIGGDLAKAYYAGKKANKKTAAFAGVFMDRFLAIIPFSLIPAFTITLYRHKIENKILIAVVYLVLIVCFLLLWLLMNKNMVKYLKFILKPFKAQAWYKKIGKGYSYLSIYSKHKPVVLLNFIISLAVQVISIISIYFFARAVGVDNVGLGVFFIYVPIIGILSMLPSLNGLGVREGGYVYFFKSHMQAENAFAVSILVLATLTIFGIIGGIIYLLKKEKFSYKTEELI